MSTSVRSDSLRYADARPALRTRAWRMAMTARRIAARPTAAWRVLPDFLIVGSQRAGTTSLHHYLAQSPAVQPPALTKGVHWFDVNYDRPVGWYRAHFPTRARMQAIARSNDGRAVTGEGSPYYMFHPDVPRRIAAHLPDVRLLVVLRDPVERAWSHYHHEAARGFEPLGFEAALDAEAERLAGEEVRLLDDETAVSFHHQHHAYVARGRYADQLERLWSHVGRDRVLVLDSSDLKQQTQATCNRVAEFLDIPPWPLEDASGHNARRYAPMPDHVRDRLAATFAEDNRRLFDLLDTEYPWTHP